MSDIPEPSHYLGVTVDRTQDNIAFTFPLESLLQVTRDEVRRAIFMEVCEQFAMVMADTYPLVIPDRVEYKLVHRDAYDEFVRYLSQHGRLPLQ